MTLKTQSFVAKGVNRALASLLVFVMAVGVAFAQTETGQITGTVIDQNGAAVAGATVTAKSPDTGFTRVTTTTGTGAYTLANITAGKYNVSVEATGFTGKPQTVVVTVGKPSSLDFNLTAGGISYTAEVTGADEGIQANTTNQTL